MDDAGIDVSVSYRIEHRTGEGTTVVRHLVEPDRRTGTSMISRVFQEVLAGFQARGETGVLVMIEEDTGREVESSVIDPSAHSEPS